MLSSVDSSTRNRNLIDMFNLSAATSISARGFPSGVGVQIPPTLHALAARLGVKPFFSRACDDAELSSYYDVAECSSARAPRSYAFISRVVLQTGASVASPPLRFLDAGVRVLFPTREPLEVARWSMRSDDSRVYDAFSETEAAW